MPTTNPPSTPHQTLTIRNPPFTYLHLTLLSSSVLALDILTARTYLTSALQQFLGVTGTAIPIDFLKVEGPDAWVRVPREDGGAVVSAVTGWVGGGTGGAVGWRVVGRGDWLGSVVAGGGREVFED